MIGVNSFEFKQIETFQYLMGQFQIAARIRWGVFYRYTQNKSPLGKEGRFVLNLRIFPNGIKNNKVLSSYKEFHRTVYS